MTKDYIEELPEGAAVIKILQNNRWGNSLQGKWLACTLGMGSDDYICMGEHFIDTEISVSCIADTAQEAARLLLEKIKANV